MDDTKLPTNFTDSQFVGSVATLACNSENGFVFTDVVNGFVFDDVNGEITEQQYCTMTQGWMLNGTGIICMGMLFIMRQARADDQDSWGQGAMTSSIR